MNDLDILESNTKMICHNCGEPGHFSRECTKERKEGNQNKFAWAFAFMMCARRAAPSYEDGGVLPMALPSFGDVKLADALLRWTGILDSGAAKLANRLCL